MGGVQQMAKSTKFSLHRLALPVGIAVAAGGSVLLGPNANTLSAQSANANAAPVCLMRTLDDGARLDVIAPATDVGGLTKKGFQPTSCNVAFATVEQRETWRDAICTIVATANHGVQDAMEAKLGERPNVLCGMAEIAVGEWRRGPGGAQ